MKCLAIFTISVGVIFQGGGATPAFAIAAPQIPSAEKVEFNSGVGTTFRPATNQPGRSAYVSLNHIRQEPWLCVPTSATMVLSHYGVKTSPRELKALCDGRDYHPGQPFHYYKFTYFSELMKGVSKLGCTWRFGSFPLTEEGFKAGLTQVKAALDRGQPPLVDTSLYGDHTFVICGYDEAAGKLLIMDPNIPAPGFRMLTYEQFARVWNSDGVNCHYRAVLFTTGKRRA